MWSKAQNPSSLLSRSPCRPCKGIDDSGHSVGVQCTALPHKPEAESSKTTTTNCLRTPTPPPPPPKKKKIIINKKYIYIYSLYGKYGDCYLVYIEGSLANSRYSTLELPVREFNSFLSPTVFLRFRKANHVRGRRGAQKTQRVGPPRGFPPKKQDA